MRVALLASEVVALVPSVAAGGCRMSSTGCSMLRSWRRLILGHLRGEVVCGETRHRMCSIWPQNEIWQCGLCCDFLKKRRL